MVDQGGAGGAYESGGYNGQATYVDSGIGQAIAGFGKTLGAALGSGTAADDNASDIKKSERLGNQLKTDYSSSANLKGSKKVDSPPTKQIKVANKKAPIKMKKC